MKRYLEFINEHVNWNGKLISFAYNGDLEGVKKALYNGADIHYENDRALRWAADDGNLEVVKYLVEKGSDIHAEDDYALIWAYKYNQLDVVKYICEYIIQKEPWYIPKIMEYIPNELKEKYAHLLAASDMDLL